MFFPELLQAFAMHMAVDHLSRQADAKTPMPVVIVEPKAGTPAATMTPAAIPVTTVGAVRRAFRAKMLGDFLKVST